MELLATGFYWLPGFNATCYSIFESCPIVNQNIVESKIKFKINDTSMTDFNHSKLWLSLKALVVVNWKLSQNVKCFKSKINSVVNM